MPSEAGYPATTIAAVSTPVGRGGIGIIRISGPGSLEFSLRLSRRVQPWQPRHASFSSWYDPDGRLLDSGLVLFFPAPDSYTGEDVVELHGHANPVLMQAMLNLLFDLGARPAEPGEFTRRAVENNKMDLSQAEAVIASIDAATLRAAHQAQRHLCGEFGHLIERLMSCLTGILAHIEACLDFPEEEVPPALFDELELQLRRDLLQPIESLLDSAGFGERLLHGATVAITGAPNAGKSSLLNRLAAHDRAIVSDMPGTTRDTLEVALEVKGIPLRLIDTAGIRDGGGDCIEMEGVERARRAAAAADLVMFVADFSRPETWEMPMPAGLKVMNKLDLCPDREIPAGFLPVSALTGEGIGTIKQEIALSLELMPAAEEGLLVTCERHRQALKQARGLLVDSLALLGREDYLELIAQDWRQAHAALGSILGYGDIEDILDRIFSEFCIGK